MKILSAIAVSIGLSAGLATPASALNARTWISGKGVDQAGCGPIASPCRTLQYAYDATSSGGEIDVLDGAGYGSLTINKPISIINEGAGVAGVLASPGLSAIYIYVGSTSDVVLRGLTIEGGGVGANGIVFANGGSLTIANCLIKDFVGSSDNAGNGIVLRAGSGSPKIVVTDTTVQNNEYVGLYFRSTANSGASLVADRVVATNNGYGISVTVAAGGSVQNASISNSLATNNAQRGIENIADTGASSVFISNTVVAQNGGSGVYQRGARAETTLSKNELVANPRIYDSTHFDVEVASGKVYTLKNNHIGTLNATLAEQFLR